MQWPHHRLVSPATDERCAWRLARSAEDDAHRGCLAGAVRAEEASCPPRSHFETDTAECRNAAVAPVEVGDLDNDADVSRLAS